MLSALTVLNTDDSGAGSLRQAILDANNNAGADEIGFNIPGDGVHTIAPLTPLPWMIGGGPVTIDATTQPGFSHDGPRLIELSGAKIPAALTLTAHGLVVSGSDNLIRGLAVNRFHTGINVSGDGNRIEGNYIGLDPTGTFVARADDNSSMERGIVLGGGSNSIVGGSTDEARNVIAGNTYGVWIQNAADNKIVGNYVDTDKTGLVPLSNNLGVFVFGANRNHIGEPGDGNTIGSVEIQGGSDNTVQANRVGVMVINGGARNLIGGSAAGERNLIDDYVSISAGDHNKVQGNYIGLTSDGTQRSGRGGVQVYMSRDNVIGVDGDGVADGAEGNVIGGGVQVNGGVNNVVAGNLIGTDASGMVALGVHPHPDYRHNGTFVADGARFTRIGTNGDGLSDELERNVISGGWENGVRILYDTDSNVIAGNYIGTNKTGDAALPNGRGVTLQGADNRLGTNGDGVNDDAERNVVSGNLDVGVWVGGDNLVAGNYIGTDATGLLELGNGVGIVLGGADSTIGGATAGTGNVISGNHGAGIDSYSSGNVIQGNSIGVDNTETGPLGNGGDGIWLRFGAFENTIGAAMGAGDEASAANVIAYNGRNGITVSEGLAQSIPVVPATANSIRGNSIYANDALGIDLGELAFQGGDPGYYLNYSYVFGVTPNDPLDADAGNNQLQNFPELTAASSAASTRLQGSLNSTPHSTFVLDFYANSAADPSGYGEGQRWLGAATVITDANGDAAFNVVLSAATSAGTFITATATDAAGNTSEFSLALESITAVQTVSVDIRQESVNVDSHGTLTVVIFGEAGFDASQVDVGSVRFAEAAAWEFTLVDLNNDGHLDLQLKFRTQDTILDQIYAGLLRDDVDADGVLDFTRQTAQVALTGGTLNDAFFSGSDDVTLFLGGRSLRELLDDLFG